MRLKLGAHRAAALGLAAIAFVISPIGIRLLTGRQDLTFRINVVSLCFVAFLLAIVGALLFDGRGRKLFFYLVAWTFPFAALGSLELAAIGTHLADRISPMEDMSPMANYRRWPSYLMTDARRYDDKDLMLYRPWQGDGIYINELGLRTAMPKPKMPGEWRVAISGGSTVWGWRVLDADTLSANLEEILHARGRANVSVYNFGIEGSQIAMDLALLKRFREVYAIDQAIFYVGVNDCVLSYLAEVNAGSVPLQITRFELVRAVDRLTSSFITSEPPGVQKWNANVLPRLREESSLRAGVVAAANYCAESGLKCDFVLQPSLFDRKNANNREAQLRRIIEQANPGMDRGCVESYAGALEAGPPGHTYDWRDVFKDEPRQLFADVAHVSEIGNKIVAERLAALVGQAGPR